jgi:putative flippase GtrA
MTRITLERRAAVGRVARFSAVGVLNTLIDVGVFVALVWWVRMPIVPANLLAFAAALANSYVLNRSWTFRDSRAAASPENVARFVLFSCVGALIATGALWLLRQAGLPVLAAKLLSVLVGMTWNYLTMRHLVFTTPR